MAYKDFEAGDFIIEDIQIYGQLLPRVSIRNLMMELNIYEDIHSPFVSGNIIIRDTMNHRANMSMTGQEEIEFTLRTNDECEEMDFKTERMRIYKIDNIIPTSNTEQSYTLHFISLDAMRNSQTRVKGAYRGSSDQIAKRILKDVLKTEHAYYCEASGKFIHVLGNNRHPFEFLRICANKSISRRHNTPGYLFYKNHRGYNFCSRNDILFDRNREPVEVVEDYFTAYQRPRVDVTEEMRTLLNYQVKNAQDTIRDNTNGLMNNTHYTFNRTGKSFTKNVSSYETYSNSKLLDGEILYTTTPEKNREGLFDFSDGTVTTSSFDKYLHSIDANDTHDYTNTGSKDPDRLRETSSYLQRVKVQMHGNSNLAAGDVIRLNLPKHEPVDTPQKEQYDVFMSGRYIIESINHQVSNLGYITTCDCIKASVEVPYESNKQSIKDTNLDKQKTPTEVSQRL